jgi:hypothetical protein
MKRPEAERPDLDNDASAHPFPGHADFRGADFRGVWIFEPETPIAPGEIHYLVAISFSADWDRDRLGHVSIFPLKQLICAVSLTPIFRGC